VLFPGLQIRTQSVKSLGFPFVRYDSELRPCYLLELPLGELSGEDVETDLVVDVVSLSVPHLPRLSQLVVVAFP